MGNLGEGKERWKLIAKGALGALLVTYVLQSKMIDFDSLKSLLKNPVNFTIAILFMLFSAVCCAARWYLLVRTQGLALSFRNLFSLTMIGSFFNTFMPGAVGGDLIKAWYIAGREPTRRTRAVFTVLLDRIFGLVVIVLYSAIAMALYSEWLRDHLQLRVIAYSLWAFGVASVLFVIVFYTPAFWNSRLMKGFIGFASRWERLKKIVDAFLVYRQYPKTFIGVMGLSALSTMGLTTFYTIQGFRIGIDMTVAQYFFAVPLAMVASAIPILPGGIGTGQVAFYHLFSWMGVPNPELGGTLCTLVQIYQILFNCTGALFYLKYKKRPNLSTTQKSKGYANLTIA